MPFTVTHALAVLPIYGWIKKFPLLALVIGSFVPDLPMFLPVANYSLSHSLLGIGYFCVPSGLVCYACFERFGKYLAIDLLPASIARYFQVYRHSVLSTGKLLWSVPAIALGALTHIVWDSFTHANGWIVVNFPLLNAEINVMHSEIAVFKLLQYGCSVVGLPVLAAVWWKMVCTGFPAAESIVRPSNSLFVWVVLTTFTCVSITLLIRAFDVATTFYQFVGISVVSLIGGYLTLFTFLALIYWIILPRYGLKTIVYRAQ